MAVTYYLQYRIKGNTEWLYQGGTPTPVNRDVNNQMTATLTGLTTNTTYEFRWQRDVNGTITANSNIIETAMPTVSTIPTVAPGGQLTSSGTFTLNNASSTSIGTAVRSTTKLTLQFANASWKYARVNAMSLSGVSIAGDYYVFNNTDNPSFNTPTVVSSTDSSVIVRTSNRTVDVLLSRDYAYTLILYPASGSTTFTVIGF